MKGGGPPVLSTSPSDPVLRAIWTVNQTGGLTLLERMALLALWRYLGKERKPIGGALLARLIHTTTGTARVILKRLRSKGLVGSDGSRKQKTGKAATRWLTDKIQWPDAKARHGNRCSHPNDGKVGTGAPVKVGTGAPTDLGVRQAAALSVPDTRPKSGGRADDETSDVEIADVIFGGGES